MKKLPAQPLSGLIDGVAIIQALTLSFEPVSTTELSIKTGMEKTRVNRILKTLDFMGMAYRTTDRKYAIGTGIHVLSAQSLYASGLIQTAVKQLEPLQKYNFVVALGFLAEDKVCYLYHWQPGISTIDALGRLAMYPVEKSSIGIALLSYKDAEYRQKVKDLIVARNGSADSIDDDIENYKKNQFSRIIENDNTSIAVTLGNPVFGAIALSGIFPPSKENELVKELSETVKKIELEMKTRNKKS